jgi:hypothetical protein
MVDLVPPVETILDERAKHAVLLVDAVKERAYVTMLADSSSGGLRGVLGAPHILTSTQRVQLQPGESVSRRPIRIRT